MNDDDYKTLGVEPPRMRAAARSSPLLTLGLMLAALGPPAERRDLTRPLVFPAAGPLPPLRRGRRRGR